MDGGRDILPCKQYGIELGQAVRHMVETIRSAQVVDGHLDLHSHYILIEAGETMDKV